MVVWGVCGNGGVWFVKVNCGIVSVWILCVKCGVCLWCDCGMLWHVWSVACECESNLQCVWLWCV